MADPGPMLGAAIVLAGTAVGTLSALFGVGGGLVMVPFMVLVLGVSAHAAEGTSLLVIVPTAIAGTAAHTRSGYVSLRRAGLLAVGGIGGAYIGANLALAISAESLRDFFAVFLAVMGLRRIGDGVRSLRAERRGASLPS